MVTRGGKPQPGDKMIAPDGRIAVVIRRTSGQDDYAVVYHWQDEPGGRDEWLLTAPWQFSHNGWRVVDR